MKASMANPRYTLLHYRFVRCLFSTVVLNRKNVKSQVIDIITH